jgi:tryptophan synthase beta subunit
VVVNVSGRGDKDMSTYMRYMDTYKPEQGETIK